MNFLAFLNEFSLSDEMFAEKIQAYQNKETLVNFISHNN
jgi:hypothetical protein